MILLIPAYRPPPSLPNLIAEVLQNGPIRRAVVVDDGSGPEFAGTFASLRAMDRVEVFDHAVNLGKGAALKSGFNRILTSGGNVTAILTADADGQHKPADILRLAAAHASQPDRLILGVRSFNGAVPFRSRLGNTVSRWVFHALTGCALRDTQTGLRVWPRALCLEALRLPFNGYEFEFEALLKTPPARLAQIPIQTVYEDGNASSHFNPIRDSLRIYFVFLRYSASALLMAALDSSVFSFVLWRTGNLAQAQWTGRGVATVAAFFILRNLVFRSTASFWPPLLKFLALVAVSGAVSLGLIRVLTGYGFPPLAAKLLAEGTLFAANFAVQRTLVFRRD